MTLRCPTCECTDIELTGDNGAEYPQTRVECYECGDCGHSWTGVLTA
jgi:hypothetical protein